MKRGGYRRMELYLPGQRYREDTWEGCIQGLRRVTEIDE